MYALHLVTWNGVRYMPLLLASLHQQTIQPHTVRILDNGSTDGTREYLEKNIPNLFPQAEIVYETTNHGFAGGHNILGKKMMEEKRGEEFVWLVNQDLYIEKNYIESVMNVMRDHENSASASGVLLQWKNSNEIPNRENPVIDSLGITSNQWGKFYEIGNGEHNLPTHDEVVMGVSGTCPVYRIAQLTEALHPSGMIFDPTFRSYKEDVELSIRLYERGYTSIVVADAIAFHDRTLAKNTKRDARQLTSRINSYRNHLAVLALHDLASVSVVVYEITKFLYLLVKETRVLKGFIDFLRLIPTIVATRREYRNRAKRHYSL